MQFPSRALESSSIFASPFPVAALSPVLHGAPDYEARLQSSRTVNPSLVSPTASVWTLSSSRRVFDFIVALLVLAALAVPMLAIALCVRLTSRDLHSLPSIAWAAEVVSFASTSSAA